MADTVRARVARLADELDWLRTKASRELRSRMGGIERRIRPPTIVPNPDGKVLIHLGCGEIDAPGFINVDGKALPHVHYVADVAALPMFESGSADLVYACHLLEHFNADEHRAVLWEWARVLRPGGVLRIAVPDFDKLVTLYQAMGNQARSIGGILMGEDDGYPPHRWIFNQEYLSDVMQQAGLCDVRQWDPDQVEHHDFEDWASRQVVRDGRHYPISLNLEGIK